MVFAESFVKHFMLEIIFWNCLSHSKQRCVVLQLKTNNTTSCFSISLAQTICHNMHRSRHSNKPHSTLASSHISHILPRHNNTIPPPPPPMKVWYFLFATQVLACTRKLKKDKSRSFCVRDGTIRHGGSRWERVCVCVVSGGKFQLINFCHSQFSLVC